MAEERWCDWHVVHIYEDGDDRIVDVLHPDDCGITISIGANGPGTIVERHCWVAFQLANSYPQIGYFDTSKEPLGWYRVRGRTFSTYFPGVGTEYDDDQEAEKMTWIPFEERTESEAERSGF